MGGQTLRIVMMGTGGAGGPAGRAHNCVLVEAGDARIVLDFGEACSWRLEEMGLTLCDLDLVYISHLHGDHYFGLFDASVRALASGCRRVRVGVAEPLLEPARETILSLLPRSMRAETVFYELRGAWRAGSLTVEPVEVCHAVPAWGVLLSEDGGPTLFYSGDTRVCDRYASALGRADVVVHEVALPGGLERIAEEKGHTTIGQVVEIRSRMRDGAVLVLTHFSRESLAQALAWRGMPRGVVVPGDGTVLSV